MKPWNDGGEVPGPRRTIVRASRHGPRIVADRDRHAGDRRGADSPCGQQTVDDSRDRRNLVRSPRGVGTGPIDWSGDGAIVTTPLPSPVDINSDGAFTTMAGSNDWARIVLPFACEASVTANGCV